MGEVGTRKTGGLSILLLATMFLGYAVYAVDRTVLSAVLPLVSSSLSLSNTQLGLLVAAQYIGVLAIVYFAGSLSDRYGRMQIVLLGLVVFTVFTWMIGLASNFAEAFAFRLVSGLGEGVFWPVAMASIAAYFGQRKGFALGIFYVGFDVGSAAGPALAGFTLSLTSDWRYAFLVAPLFGVAPIVMALLQKPQSGAPSAEVERPTMGAEARRLMRQRNVALVMIFAFLATWASVWQVTFLPYYFNKVLHYGVVYSAYLAALVPISGAVGKLTLGRVSDRVNRRWALALVSLLVVISYVSFFSLSVLYLLVLAAIVMSFFSSSIFPIMQALMADSCGGRLGAALGLSTTSQSVATVFSTFISASLFALGIGRVLAANATLPAVLMVVVALLMKEPRNQKGDRYAGIDKAS